MEIQSAFSSGLQGLQKASEDASKAASDIVQQTASEERALESQQVQPQAQTTPVAQEPTGLTESIVNLKVAEVQAKASAEVVQTADETLGTLIDVRV